ncbi:hypothetical protein SOP85_01840 [Pseudomonas sp. YuFO20]|uniref:hypothetical protein n=1 Tax=Pseudomonas sp. YuFO20 TaxID=3095362 RepID=UPI002B25250A|nr:hypothetical protein [Pseudomonas sp. YuFO20]MEB2514183.1 hypothetical protein [Pseudomonas sp. YuFO20]
MNDWSEHPAGFKYKKIEISLLDESARDIFLRRRDAVVMRLNGVSLKEVSDATGVAGSNIIRLIKRFKTRADDGICLGEIALIPGQRIKQYERKKPLPEKRTEQKGGMAGAMGLLLRANPDIQSEFVVKVLSLDAPVGKGTRYQKTILCKDFYNICRANGVKEHEWPLSQQRAANRTVCTLIDDILESNFSSGVLVVGGTKSSIRSFIGRGIEPLLCNIDVLDVLEIDSHFLDGIFVLNLKGDRRLTTEDVIDRFWIICARCRRSKAVFAARYVFASEVTALDVFQVICDAFLGNWCPQVSFSFPDLKYVPGAGMPAFVHPEIKYHCITAIYFDNAMQHYANDVKELCLDVLGIAIDYGPLNLPSRRSTVEGLFGTIANRVLHTLSSTTGRNPFDGRSEDPGKAAVYYNINVDEALEVLDCYIANFNATPMSGTNKSNSPLEAIAAYLNSSDIFIPVMSSVLVDVKGIGLITRKVRVQGSLANGVRPRVKLDKALYSSREFSDMPQLIGQYVYVKINPADYRKVTVYLENGIELGELLVEAAWRDYKHSIQTRKLINRAHDKKVFQIFAGQSPIVVYRNYLVTTKSSANNRELKRLDDELNCENHLPLTTSQGKPVPIATPNTFSDGIQQKQTPKWEVMDEFKF